MLKSKLIVRSFLKILHKNQKSLIVSESTWSKIQCRVSEAGSFKNSWFANNFASHFLPFCSHIRTRLDLNIKMKLSLYIFYILFVISYFFLYTFFYTSPFFVCNHTWSIPEMHACASEYAWKCKAVGIAIREDHYLEVWHNFS